MAHFFEADLSLCKHVLKDEDEWEKVPARPGLVHRCTHCSTLLGQVHTQLEETAAASREMADAPVPSVADWHLARAVALERKAAEVGGRFQKVLLLAEAKAERIRARRAANPSSFGKVEFP